MSFGTGRNVVSEMVGDPSAWSGPLDGTDIEAGVGASIGGRGFGASLSVNVWTAIIILGALALLWFFGGVVFRKINLP